jgi:transcriptional regulator of acetoin/glycerol metabolism
LIETFWERLAVDTATRLGDDAFDILMRYHWPGNLRQFTGTLRTLIALAGPGGTVHAADLPALLHAQGPQPDSGQPPPSHAAAALSDITERAMRQALDKHAGNVSAAARSLGVSRGTLYRRLNTTS